jgi:hypothetical protein
MNGTADALAMSGDDKKEFKEGVEEFFEIYFNNLEKNGRYPAEFPFLNLCSPEVQTAHRRRKK